MLNIINQLMWSSRMKKLLLLLLLIILPNLAQAEQYRVYVTRVESDFYSADANNFLIKTWGCYEYAYSQGATLTISGYIMKLEFDRGRTCTVEAIYEKIR